MEPKVDGMLTNEQKTEMVNRIREFIGANTHAEFGRKMGFSSQNAYAWVDRGTFNAELVKARYPEISGDWLLTGKGDMLLPKVVETVEVEPTVRTDEEPVGMRKAIDALVEEQKLTAKAQTQSDKLIDLVRELSKALSNLAPLG